MEQHFLITPPLPEPIDGEILLSFHGDATKNHTIDLELYAQSLQGFYKAFTKANKNLLSADITVEIIGEHEGSIVAKIKYAGKIAGVGIGTYAAVASILSFHGLEYEDVENYLYNTFASTIESIKQCKGNIADFEKLPINIDDKDKQRYLALLKNSEYQIALDDMTFFLESNGMDELKIDSGTASVAISANDRPYFKAQLEDSKIIEEFEDNICVISISRTRMWRFRSLKIGKEFNADILDDVFFDSIQHYPVEDVFDMSFTAIIVKTSITRAGKKKADPPTYSIDDFREIPKQATLLSSTAKNAPQ